MITFNTCGNLRFLSHAEMVKLFQRSCVRAGINLRYSQGFNPRPKMSLPLPRTVGVESESDLLYLQLDSIADESQIKTRLSEQLPAGCELLDVKIAKKKVSLQPNLVTYIFPLQREHLNENLRDRIADLLKTESLIIQRRIDAKGNIRQVDVRGFLESIKIDNANVVVECRVSSAGSIRVEEILKLLELGTAELTAPVKRTNIKWNFN